MSAARSVPELLLHRIEATPDLEAFRHPDPGGWRSVPWRDVGERVRHIAGGLRSLGLGREDRAAILSGTRLEWILVDLGVLCAGGATTTVYPSSTADECAYILEDSGSLVVFAENGKQVEKIAAHRQRLSHVRHVVVIDGDGSADGWVIPLAELMSRGRTEDARDPDAFHRIARETEPHALATLIYTSGTTGHPKGVELTHDNWIYEAEAIAGLGLVRSDDLQYLWLPLAHSFGKVLEVAQLRVGFPTVVDGRFEKVVENLPVVRPTFVAAVPRMFEKVHAKIAAGSGSPLRQALVRWAFDVGRRSSRLRRGGREPGALLSLQERVATRLVFSKLQGRFGGRLRFFISGSAPLAPELSEFFHAAGILILEGYGLTETSAATFANVPEQFRFGTVGRPLPGTEVRIAPEDGEILVRGRGVMRGYRNRPEATQEALDPDGWLRTGDIGEIQEGGFLRITDRKKDLIKTSGGKYVAPQELEGKLKAACPLLGHVIVHGNNRPFCTVMVTLEPDAARDWAARSGVAGGYGEIVRSPQAMAAVQGAVDRVNATLPSYATLKKLAILPADLTQESGDLTPSLKLKRKTVEEKHRAVLDAFYAEPRP